MAVTIEPGHYVIFDHEYIEDWHDIVPLFIFETPHGAGNYDVLMRMSGGSRTKIDDVICDYNNLCIVSLTDLMRLSRFYLPHQKNIMFAIAKLGFHFLVTRPTAIETTSAHDIKIGNILIYLSDPNCNANRIWRENGANPEARIERNLTGYLAVSIDTKDKAFSWNMMTERLCAQVSNQTIRDIGLA